METFRPGDRVVAINTDHSRALCPPKTPESHPFTFPLGKLQRGVVYHVYAVSKCADGSQGLSLTGLPVFWGSCEIPWNSRRFRKLTGARCRAAAHRNRTPAPV